jgi:uncharacterized protein YjiK
LNTFTNSDKELLKKLILIVAVLSLGLKSDDSALNHYDFNGGKQYELTKKLWEISGLANSPDNNLYAITDEIGIVYKISSKDGKVMKRFFMGRWTVEADFEGIAAKGDTIFAITSVGKLYAFREGKNGKPVRFQDKKLPFSDKFEIEGLYYDRKLDGLLIASKEYPGKQYKGKRTVFFYSLKRRNLDKTPKFSISLDVLKKDFKIKDFQPSGITKHPTNGNYLLISAKGQNAIVEVNPSGKIIAAKKLNEKKHSQPEGIAIMNDKTMIISDEGKGNKPMITRYTYKR